MSAVPFWQGIAEFVCVVEGGSFTAAAARLRVSTAQVSRQVSQLEQRLGTQLLHRTTRKVRVTELGKRYYQHCRQLMDGFENAENSLLEMQTTPRGTLRLTAPMTFGERTLMPMLNDLLERFPQLQFDIELTNTRLDIIDAGFDLAIRLGHLEDSRLRARQLSDRRVYTCASPQYLQQQGTPETPADLKQHSCLVGSVGHWRFTENGRERNHTVSGRLKCNSGLSLLDAALKNLGIVQLPEEYVQAKINSGELLEVLQPYRPGTEGIWALYPATRWVSPNVSIVVDHLKAALPARLRRT